MQARRTRQLQLQNLVIESFVPPEEVAKLERIIESSADSRAAMARRAALSERRRVPLARGRGAISFLRSEAPVAR